jgi:hypothetical protein
MNDGWQIMFLNRTKFMVLFTIAVASSLTTIGGLTSSAFADTLKSTSQSYLLLPITAGEQRENPGDDSSDDDSPPPAVLRKGESHNAEDSDWTTADNNTIPEKYMNGLSNCESSAAADGHLTLVEIMDCFYQVF